MSAFLCSPDLINLIVNASDNPTEDAFEMLLEENLRSLRHRYGGPTIDDHEGKYLHEYKFERIEPAALVQRVYAERQDSAPHYRAVTQEVTPERVAAQIRQACACLDYQSCEHPEWEASDAYALVTALMASIPENEKLEHEALWSF